MSESGAGGGCSTGPIQPGMGGVLIKYYLPPIPLKYISSGDIIDCKLIYARSPSPLNENTYRFHALKVLHVYEDITSGFATINLVNDYDSTFISMKTGRLIENVVECKSNDKAITIQRFYRKWKQRMKIKNRIYRLRLSTQILPNLAAISANYLC